MGARAVRTGGQSAYGPAARRGRAPARNLPFTERVCGALAFEAFNLSNRQPVTGLNTVAYTAVAPAGGSRQRGAETGRGRRGYRFRCLLEDNLALAAAKFDPLDAICAICLRSRDGSLVKLLFLSLYLGGRVYLVSILIC